MKPQGARPISGMPIGPDPWARAMVADDGWATVAPRLVAAGQLLLIAGIDAALAALEEAPTEWQPASRAVVSDDGHSIRAIALAGELIVVMLLKLKRA
jgi:hypothetical protein